MRIVGIIPARYASCRFPGKVLVDIGGQTMIERVYRQAKKSRALERVIVATDDEKILREVKKFGGEVRATSSQHRSGTDRVAEVASRLRLPREAIIVNIQGDAPFLPPGMIDRLVKPLLDHPEVNMVALCGRIKKARELSSPNIVKVALDREGFALYFSRLPIPYLRDKTPSSQLLTFSYYKHIGPYAYRKSFLLKLAKMSPTPLEKSEKLEQLRVLENSYRIKMVKTGYDCPEVDTPEDLKKVKALKKIAFISGPD
ncbi:3-deoxy-manno-octulosonate cytidylyltransferase [candidate division NPL-UPA2 bacterium]|nr:3-deoxy-manno-octulosonate cytidylyltransferase [candidate division NPL-UPA2 bacterium]